jgi:hypothetical protein
MKKTATKIILYARQGASREEYIEEKKKETLEPKNKWKIYVTYKFYAHLLFHFCLFLLANLRPFYAIISLAETFIFLILPIYLLYILMYLFGCAFTRRDFIYISNVNAGSGNMESSINRANA